MITSPARPRAHAVPITASYLYDYSTYQRSVTSRIHSQYRILHTRALVGNGNWYTVSVKLNLALSGSCVA